MISFFLLRITGLPFDAEVVDSSHTLQDAGLKVSDDYNTTLTHPLTHTLIAAGSMMTNTIIRVIH